MNNKTGFWILIILILINIFGHELAEKPFEWFVSVYGNAVLKNIFNAVFLIGVIGGAYYFYRRLQRLPHRRTLSIYFILTLIPTIWCYLYLMPYRSEGIHFIQYGLLGVVCMAWKRDFWFSINFVFLNGIIDECYQYILGNSAYLDFNDMILNFFGGALGSLLYLGISGKSIREKISIKRHIPYILVCIFVIILGVLLLFEVLCLFRDSGCEYYLIKGDNGGLPDSFWSDTNFGVDWHRVRPYEGMVLILLIPLAYLGVEKKLGF